jgi:DNA-binding NarL/FixJ family response regulator
VLVVTGTTDRMEIAAALEAGAVGYVCKNEPFDVLLETAAQAAADEPVLPEAERRSLVSELRRHRASVADERARFGRLTPREGEVLQALCAGESVTSIAAGWVVSVPTVRTQVRAILQKLEVGSQLEAVAAAHRCGWAERRTA